MSQPTQPIDILSAILHEKDRQHLEDFVLKSAKYVDPVFVQETIGHAMHCVANEHLSAGRQAPFQPDAQYSSEEISGFLAKTMLKPEFYTKFLREQSALEQNGRGETADGLKAMLDAEAQNPDSFEARLRDQRQQKTQPQKTR